jgi:hypothetical protein
LRRAPCGERLLRNHFLRLGLLAPGQGREEILRAYPYLKAAAINEALREAASLAEDEVIELGG